MVGTSSTAARCFLVLLLVGCVSLSVFARGNEGYIYGRIIMDNDNVYQGIIRWADEEAFWTDTFNSAKVETVFDIHYHSLKNIDELEDEFYGFRDRYRRDRRSRDWRFLRDLIDDGDYDLTRQFKCQFGDIKRMRMRGSDTVILTFKNDEELEIEGGSNDIGADIKIYDDEIGDMDLNWRRIDIIEFMPTPRNLEDTFGEPLYGTVETPVGTFEGFIQWDNDECLSTDRLDGESDDGDVEIPFGKIRSIEAYRRGSLVTLKSGRELYLTNSNDVDDDNRGTVVKNPEYGKVLIGWRDFDSIEFKDVDGTGPAYDEFPAPKWISGEVKKTDGERLEGRLVFDMDESLDLEILDGTDGSIEYMIPFRNISKIIPDGRYGSKVILESGREVHLEDSHDVDEDNDGSLVWVKKDEAVYVPWRQVDEVIFD